MAAPRQGRAAEADVDVNYLFLRQQTERSRAATATSDVARRIHEQLANEYERLIEDATEGRVSFVDSLKVAPLRQRTPASRKSLT
jgi:cell division protein FtsL